MDNLTPAEQSEYDRIQRNLTEAKDFCEKHGIDQLQALGLVDKPSRLMPCTESKWPDGLKREDSGWKFTETSQTPKADDV